MDYLRIFSLLSVQSGCLGGTYLPSLDLEHYALAGLPMAHSNRSLAEIAQRERIVCLDSGGGRGGDGSQAKVRTSLLPPIILTGGIVLIQQFVIGRVGR